MTKKSQLYQKVCDSELLSHTFLFAEDNRIKRTLSHQSLSGSLPVSYYNSGNEHKGLDFRRKHRHYQD